MITAVKMYIERVGIDEMTRNLKGAVCPTSSILTQSKIVSKVQSVS